MFCKQYAEGVKVTMQAERNSIILSGAYGTGKTHLAAAIANSYIAQGIPVLFATFGQHLERLKDEFNSGRPRTYLAQMKTVPMLMLDDVGKEKQTEWSAATMFDVINARYENLMPIVITTNYDMRQLQGYFGQACYSRLIEMCTVVTVYGNDRRREKI